MTARGALTHFEELQQKVQVQELMNAMDQQDQDKQDRQTQDKNAQEQAQRFQAAFESQARMYRLVDFLVTRVDAPFTYEDICLTDGDMRLLGAYLRRLMGFVPPSMPQQPQELVVQLDGREIARAILPHITSQLRNGGDPRNF